MPQDPPAITDHDPPVSHPPPPIRVGHGYDIHRLATPAEGGRPLVIGGVRVRHDRGPVAHSDGDALLHAVTDALLGALAMPDIGELFPNNDPANDDRPSSEFVTEAVRRARERGYSVLNLDATLILERPPLKPIKHEVIRSLASLLGIPSDCANVKGKTHEGVDATGENRAIEAHAVVVLHKTTAQ
jgi:2-C-methyl-D-erythritol 2,4-cyclodiphosphate synthase